MLGMLLFQLWQLWLRCIFFFYHFVIVFQDSVSHFQTKLSFYYYYPQSVGMRPLEKSLEKLDDVRRKKLSEMIAGSGGVSTAVSSSGLLSFFIHSSMPWSAIYLIIFILISSLHISIDFPLQFLLILQEEVCLTQRLVSIMLKINNL